MSPIAALLILASAVMHALWNFVSKRRDPSLAFFFVTSLAAAVVVTPLVVVFRGTLPRIPGTVWGLVIATGVAQAIYFSGLAGAYRRGDVSLAYPLARALPVLMVAAVSLLLGRGGSIATIGLVGMVLITAGCVVLPLPRFGAMRPRDYFDGLYGMALLAAIGTTGYTLIDDEALRRLRALLLPQLSTVEVTLLFIALQTLSTAAIIGARTMADPPERARFAALVRSRARLLTALATGLVIMATYGLVLASMAFVSDVSYVAAFRQLSIPIGALMGLTLLDEPPYPPKLLGLAVVTVGLILVGLG